MPGLAGCHDDLHAAHFIAHADAAAGDLEVVAFQRPRQELLTTLTTRAIAETKDKAATKQNEKQESNAPLLTVERIYGKPEFNAKGFSGRWLPDGSGYTLLEDSQDTPGARDIVRYDAASGDRSILVPAALLTSEGGSTPLKINKYVFSKDRSLVLIYTNSKRVWRQNTRGDYWVLDRGSRQCWQLGGDAKPSSLMFAKLAPTSQHVAYLRDGEIHVEDLRDGTIRQLTRKKSDDVINGTFDWVYEEEFQIRDGFRWSPDGQAIAYWQLDTSGVQEFTMINNTDSLYPKLIRFRHPKVGQQNSACRVGVVNISGGTTRWLKVPGDPRDHYIARMHWAENPQQIVVQQLNRLQNTNKVMLADASTGNVSTVLKEQDAAWVDVHDEMKWYDGDQRFTWISERDGWRHVYCGSRRRYPRWPWAYSSGPA